VNGKIPRHVYQREEFGLVVHSLVDLATEMTPNLVQLQSPLPQGVVSNGDQKRRIVLPVAEIAP
jgi:hypothetical protein